MTNTENQNDHGVKLEPLVSGQNLYNHTRKIYAQHWYLNYINGVDGLPDIAPKEFFEFCEILFDEKRLDEWLTKNAEQVAKNVLSR